MFKLKSVSRFAAAVLLFCLAVFAVRPPRGVWGAETADEGTYVKQLQNEIELLKQQITGDGQAQQALLESIRALQEQLDEAREQKPKAAVPKIKCAGPFVLTVSAKNATLRAPLAFRNVGSGAAENIQILAEPGADTPFSAYFKQSEGFKRALGEGSLFEATLIVTPFKNAAPGVYPLALEYLFIGPDGEPQTGKDTVFISLDFPAPVSGVSPRGVTCDKEAIIYGEPFTLAVSFENTGTRPVYAAQVTFDKLPDGVYLAAPASAAPIKELSPGETFSAPFALTALSAAKPGAYRVDFTARYKTDEGKQEEAAQPYYIVIAPQGGGKDAPRLVTGAAEGPGSVVPEQVFSVSLPVTNAGGAAAEATVVCECPEGLAVMSQDTLIFEIAPGQTQTAAFSAMAGKKAENRAHTLKFTISYAGAEGAEGEATAPKTVTQYAAVNVVNEDADDGAKSVPKIIISRYSSNPIVVKAGENFDLSVTFLNTHSQKTMKNIKAYLSATFETEKKGNVFTPVDASNTFYIDEIAPKRETTQQMTFYTVPDAEPRNYIINVNFEYEDEKGEEYASTEQFGINVKQSTKIDFSELGLPPDGNLFQPVTVYFDFYNTGKTRLSNLLIKMEGEFDAAGSSSYYGVLEPGAYEIYNMSFTPNQAGQVSGAVIISYEDDAGEVTVINRDFTMFINEAAFSEGDVGGMFIPEAPPEQKTGFAAFVSSKGFIITASVLGAAVLITAVALAARARKRRDRFEE